MPNAKRVIPPTTPVDTAITRPPRVIAERSFKLLDGEGRPIIDLHFVPPSANGGYRYELTTHVSSIWGQDPRTMIVALIDHLEALQQALLVELSHGLQVAPDIPERVTEALRELYTTSGSPPLDHLTHIADHDEDSKTR